MSEFWVIIGAGEQWYEGWIATHREQLDLLDRTTWERFFGPRRASRLLCEHVFEHLSEEEGRKAAKICFEFLEPGGFMRVAVPDINYRNAEYQNTVKVGGPGPADHPAAGHKIIYNSSRLEQVFRSAGFEVDLLEYCDPEGRFHYHHWDYTAAPIYRSFRSDHRNKGLELGFVSIILDAHKPA